MLDLETIDQYLEAIQETNANLGATWMMEYKLGAELHFTLYPF